MSGVQVVANLGCGPIGGARLPFLFNDWQQLRVDVDPSVQPDIIGDLTNLSGIPDESVDAIWAAHCVEHLFLHEVPRALNEFHRVLKRDGFACILVPDLQSVAPYIAKDRLHDTLYQSPAGPITPHDILFGHGKDIEAGRTSMAHRCGFTPSLMMQCLRQTPFVEAVLRRKATTLELVAIVQKGIARSPEERDALVAALVL
jgi:SAM-dependent methyltransferase